MVVMVWKKQNIGMFMVTLLLWYVQTSQVINVIHDEYFISGQSNFIVYVDEDNMTAALSANGELLATEKSFGGIVNFDLSTLNGIVII